MWVSRSSVLEKKDTHVINTSSEVQENRLGKLGSIDLVILAEVLDGERGGIDINEHPLVVVVCLDGFRTVRDEIVQGGQHLCKSPALALPTDELKRVCTFEEIDSISLEGSVGELEDTPHRGSDGTRVEGQTISQLVDVVEKVYNDV